MLAPSFAKLIGFSVLWGGDTQARRRFVTEHDAVLRQFPWLTLHHELNAPRQASVVVWGFGVVADLVQRTANGEALLFATGVRREALRWVEMGETLAKAISGEIGATLPWDGIVNLVRVGADSIHVWNDWTGACRVYAACAAASVCVSTLEPVVYRTMQPGIDDIAPAALYALMTTGHFFSDQTLYKSIRVQPPDTIGCYGPASRRITRRWSIQPTDKRWASGWDELVDEWGATLESEVAAGLGERRPMTLMLSGGIDSRLIAAIGVRQGFPLEAVCYGNNTWQDTQFARAIARALGLQLRLVSIGKNYLRDFTRLWCEWFGASMCVHGMYQYPGLLSLREREDAQEIVTGYTGDPLEGMQIDKLAAGPDGRPLLERIYYRTYYWRDDELQALLPWLDVPRARSEAEQVLRDQDASYPGAAFQRYWLMFQWSRMSHFSSYQPMMYEYFGGVVTPFVSRVLANFCLSLPRVALEGRRLFYDVIRDRFPEMARLPGTFDHPSQVFEFIPKRYGIPLLLTKPYVAKAAIGYLLPERLRVGPFREFAPTPNRFAQDAIAAHGIRSLFPLDIADLRKQQFFDAKVLEQFVASVLRERVDFRPNMKLWPIQAILFRLLVAP